MYFTIEDIKQAFRAGRNAEDKFADQKGFATNEFEYAKRLLNNMGMSHVGKRFCLCEEPEENWDSGQTCFCDKCNKLIDAC